MKCIILKQPFFPGITPIFFFRTACFARNIPKKFRNENMRIFVLEMGPILKTHSICQPGTIALGMAFFQNGSVGYPSFNNKPFPHLTRWFVYNGLIRPSLSYRCSSLPEKPKFKFTDLSEAWGCHAELAKYFFVVLTEQVFRQIGDTIDIVLAKM